eukprot:gene48416-64955_t
MTLSDSLAWWLSPAVLALFGLLIGSFLNVVVHRLPRMMERQWWRDIAGQLADADGWKRTFGHPAPKPVAAAATELERQLEGLGPYTLSKPRSACPICGHQIRWYENIPVVSWLWLKRRCSSCQAPISARYPFIELLTAALFGGAA